MAVTISHIGGIFDNPFSHPYNSLETPTYNIEPLIEKLIIKAHEEMKHYSSRAFVYEDWIKILPIISGKLTHVTLQNIGHEVKNKLDETVNGLRHVSGRWSFSGLWGMKVQRFTSTMRISSS